MVGTVLEGMYRIVGLVGEGGMGAVYEAMHLRLQKRVAVKVMARELAANADALSRFHREAMVTSALGHPHIVQVFDFSTTPTGEPFLVMEFLEGEDLEHRLRRVGRLSPPDTVHVVKQVASALAATHAKEIVHRDLKPANIYLLEVAGETDFVKVLDFGISKVRAATTKLTKASMIMGTPNYMSPEQALGRVDEIDERSDQWALACIAWECLAGQCPFVGENVPSILFQVVHESPPALASQLAGLPADVEEVLRCALAKDKSQRFDSVAAFSSALESALARTSPAQVDGRGLPVARTVSPPDAPGGTPPTGAGQSTTFTQTVGELDDSMVLPHTNARRIWAIAGGAVAVFAIATFLLLRPGSGAKPQVTVPVSAAPAPARAALAPPFVPPPSPPAPSAAEPAKPAPSITEPPRRPATASQRRRRKSEMVAKPVPVSPAKAEPTQLEPATPAPPARKGGRRMIKEL
jgi:serine/threonine protein kinase